MGTRENRDHARIRAARWGSYSRGQGNAGIGRRDILFSETGVGMEDRLRQTIVILRKLTEELGLPYDAPEMQAIKERMSDFVKTGDAWEGTLSLAPWGREAVLEMRASGKIELTLRSLKRTGKRGGK